MLLIEYDVRPNDRIDVALVNASEEDGLDPNGSSWMAWPVTEFDDDGLGHRAPWGSRKADREAGHPGPPVSAVATTEGT